MRIVVAGERARACDELATVVLQRLIARYGRKIVILHGGEAGVDESFSKACKSLGIAVEARLANWPQAGPFMLWSKNRELVNDGADPCIALHRSIGTSRRTRDCARKAIKKGIPTCLIADEQAVPCRVARHPSWGFAGSGASRGQPLFLVCLMGLRGVSLWGFAGSAFVGLRGVMGLRGVSLWGFAGSAFVFGLSKKAGWRRGPDNRPRRATQNERRKSYRPDGVMGFVDTSLISASPSGARVQASDASIAGFRRPNNHEGAISPS